MTSAKNAAISQSLKKTREKRLSQDCRVFKIKIDASSLKKEQEEALKMQFVEAKWLVNEAIGSGDVFKYEAGKTVVHRDKDGNEVVSEIKHLGSQMKQAVVDELRSNVKTLSSLKKVGKKVGKLKFKKQVKSINLKQYGTTYKIVGKRKIKIQNAPGEIRVNGLDQILSHKGKPKYELANAKLLNTPRGFYLAITCYSKKKERKCNGEIGIDFGISTTITLSDGRKFNASVQETDRLKKLQRKLARQKKGSKRRYKTLCLIKQEYQKMSNRKNDIANKLVAEIMKYEDIYLQDENLTGWKIRFGKQVQHSVLGRIKAKLKPKARYVLSRWEPTTKLCVECGQLHKLTLADRTFTCDCGVPPEDRDIHAAKNMIAMSKNKILGLGRPELTLAETLLDLNASAVRAEVVEARRSVKGLRGVSRQEDATSLA
jgi:putative transposase